MLPQAGFLIYAAPRVEVFLVPHQYLRPRSVPDIRIPHVCALHMRNRRGDGDVMVYPCVVFRAACVTQIGVGINHF